MGIFNKINKVYNKIIANPKVKTFGKVYDTYWNKVLGVDTDKAKNIYMKLKKTNPNSRKFLNAKNAYRKEQLIRAGAIGGTAAAGIGALSLMKPSSD